MGATVLLKPIFQSEGIFNFFDVEAFDVRLKNDRLNFSAKKKISKYLFSATMILSSKLRVVATQKIRQYFLPECLLYADKLYKSGPQ